MLAPALTITYDDGAREARRIRDNEPGVHVPQKEIVIAETHEDIKLGCGKEKG